MNERLMNLYVAAKTFAQKRKKTTAFIIVVLLLGGYWEYKNLTAVPVETRYVLGTVEKGTVIATISGSGQVSSSNQIELKPKAGGQVTYIGVHAGDLVKAGALIATLDSSDAQKNVRDAEVNLESAKISYAKLQQPADALSLTQAKNNLARAKITNQNALDALQTAYDDGYNTISNAFLDLPGVVSGLHDVLFLTSSQLGGTNVQNLDYYTSSARNFDSRATTFGADTNSKYQLALSKYNKSFQDFKQLDRNSDKATIESMLNETYDTALAVSEAVKSTNNLIQFFGDQMTQHSQTIPALSNNQLTTLNGYTGKVNADLSNLLSELSAIKSAKNTIVQSGQSIDESTQSLAKLEAGTDLLDLQSAQLNLKQKENALLDAEQNLANYYVRAPFAGTVAVLNAKLLDTVNSGTAIATLIAAKNITTISLNEVDIAKIKVGQKATLTFDAVPDITISGEVAQVDSIGAVSQGVVTYNVQIAFDTQDNRIKPGMSTSANIITDVRQEVLTLLSSAVKTSTGGSYVETLDPSITSTSAQGVTSPTAPKQQGVVVGISSDTEVEIVSGLKEGDRVITKTISPSTAAKTTTAPSLLGGGGSGVRIPRN